MSSNCSINCCSSPEVTSSNVSVNNMNGAVSNETICGRVRTTVPDTKKDNKYWERRRRNNEAARRSREKRRQNDMVMDKRIMELSQRNKQLENELFQLKMNFGLVNNNNNNNNNNTNVPKSDLNEFSKHENPSNAKHTPDHINGMVFPVFTAFPSSTESTDASDQPVGEPIVKSINTSNQLPDNQKPSTNKYHPNYISLGNIPFLSNLISTPNFNEDITSKACLLLPSLIPKTPTKSTEAPSTPALNNGPSITTDGLSLRSTPEILGDSLKRSISVDTSQLSAPSGKHLKLDFHDILDLSLKQDNGECILITTDGMTNGFDASTNINLDDESKDILKPNQIRDESLTNSFLSGILSTTSKDKLRAIRMKCKSSVGICEPNGPNKNKTNRARHNGNRYHCNAVRHHFDLTTRMHIRREVSSIVINENRKLRQDIDSLSTEIKLLKSAMLECAKLSLSQTLTSSNLTSSVLLEQHPRATMASDSDGVCIH